MLDTLRSDPMQPQILGILGYTVKKKILRQGLLDDCSEILGLFKAGRRLVNSHPITTTGISKRESSLSALGSVHM